jgi:hypothetical protein
MPAGIQVYTNGGIIQIDQDYCNFVLAQKSTVNTTTGVGGGGYITTVSLSNATNPLLAIQSTNGACTQRVSISGSTWTWTIYSQTYNQAVVCFIFDSSSSTSPGNVGFEVYRSDGSRAFHTSQSPFRPVGAGAATYTASRNYAVVMTTNDYYYAYVATADPYPLDWEFDDYLGWCAVNSNVVTTGTFIYSTANYLITPAADFTPVYAATYLVVDVTNF